MQSSDRYHVNKHKHRVLYWGTGPTQRGLITTKKILKVDGKQVGECFRLRARTNIRTHSRMYVHRVQKKSDTCVFPYISHSFWTNFIKLSANISK